MNVTKSGEYLLHHGKLFSYISDDIKKSVNIELINRPDMK